MHRALIALFLLGTFAVAGCTEELTVPDLNNPSLEDLATNPTPAGVFTAAQGLMVGGRAQAGTRNGYTSLLGILGRESYNFDGSDPRFITEMLEGELDPGSPAFGANLWTSRYQNIRNANILLDALDAVQGLDQSELEAIRGWAKTWQALDLLRVVNTRDVNGGVVDTNRPPTDDPAPIEDKNAVFAEVSSLLDAARSHLQAGGDAFPFQVHSGFAGFDTPSTFVEFNRALKARVAVYTGNFNEALTALQASFLDDAAPLDLGAYHTFGTGSGDTRNNLFDPGDSPDILAHPSVISDSPRKANGDLDNRVDAKTRAIEERTRLGVSSDVAFEIYNDASASVPIIKNEELILLRAEANVGLGNVAAAAADINLIRTQSGGLEARDDLNASNILDELLTQKWLSLLFEGGHRWIDMRRYNKLSQLPLDNANHRHNSEFPIPEAEQLARQ
jgi:hypothetical protein